MTEIGIHNKNHELATTGILLNPPSPRPSLPLPLPLLLLVLEVFQMLFQPFHLLDRHES